MFEAYQAVIGPSAEVRQAQQPCPGSRIGHLNPGEQLVAGPEGGYSGIGWISVSSGPGDSVQQHRVLTLLRFTQAANAVSSSLWVFSAATPFIGFLYPRVKRTQWDTILHESFPVKGNGVRERRGAELRQLI